VVQVAFEAGKIGLDLAAKAGAMPPDRQQLIAKRIARGESAKAVIQEVLGTGQRLRKGASTTSRGNPFVALRRAIKAIPADIKLLPEQHTVAKQGHDLLSRLLGRGEADAGKRGGTCRSQTKRPTGKGHDVQEAT
jgi:hypothetical protein